MLVHYCSAANPPCQVTPTDHPQGGTRMKPTLNFPRLQRLMEANVPGIHPFLEGGEGETFVADAPFFKKKIMIKKWKKSWDGVRGVAEIVEAELKTKSS